jgi:hypothetical protein
VAEELEADEAVQRHASVNPMDNFEFASERRPQTVSSHHQNVELAPRPLRFRRHEAHDLAVISAVAVIPTLLEACPSFRARWTAYVAEPEYDESLLYVHLGEFARHVVELLKGGSTGAGLKPGS